MTKREQQDAIREAWEILKELKHHQEIIQAIKRETYILRRKLRPPLRAVPTTLLDARAKHILRARWLNVPKTYQELAPKFSIELERVRQIENEAFAKLEQWAEENRPG